MKARTITAIQAGLPKSSRVATTAVIAGSLHVNVYHIYIVGIRLAGRQVDRLRKSGTALSRRADAPDPPPKLPTHGGAWRGSLAGAGIVWALPRHCIRLNILQRPQKQTKFR